MLITRLSRRRRSTVCLPAFALVLVCATDAPAITIVRDLVSPGEMFPSIGVTAGSAPATVVGGGELVDLFDAAADWWEAAILDPHTVTIHFGWAPLGGSTLAIHNLVAQGGVPNRETEATIQFDNDGTTNWFADPTPTDNDEWMTFVEDFDDFGGGLMNTGRRFTGYTGPLLAGQTPFDLLTAAKHEIGHALGLSSANISFQIENVDGHIDVTSPLPFGGSSIPTIAGAHLDVGTASSGSLMFPGLSPGVRKLQSAVDILTNAQISQFVDLDLDPHGAVPEPATGAMLLTGILLFATRRRLRTQPPACRGSAGDVHHPDQRNWQIETLSLAPRITSGPCAGGYIPA